LQIEEVERPVPKESEVLISVRATTVNRTDYAILTGQPFIMRFFTGLLQPSSPIPGSDFAGEVIEIGSSVSRFKVGDRVWGFNDEGLASQAEFMCYSQEENIAIFPESLTFEQAAASLEGVHYGLNFLNKVQIKAGQKVLVNGATGAIGSAILQFLVHQDIEVDAVCGGENLDLIKGLGAAHVFNYEKEDFTQSEKVYNHIFDAVGKSTFGKCKPMLKEGGTYISSELGPYAQNPFLALYTKFFGKKKVLFPLPTDIKESMAHISKLVLAGKFQPVIDRYYPLDEIAAAYQYVNTGQKIGNVVIRYQNQVS